jgi:hypothetical protein
MQGGNIAVSRDFIPNRGKMSFQGNENLKL